LWKNKKVLLFSKFRYSFELEESLGHTLAEVTVGAIFGSLVAFFLLNI